VKRFVLIVLVLVAALAFGQEFQSGGSAALSSPTRISAQVIVHDIPVTKADMYCAGFVSSQPLPREHFIAAGADTPLQSRYTPGSFVFLRGGGYTPGTRVSIVREVADFNHYSPFPAARNLLSKTGKIYRDIGYAVIKENRGTDIAVAEPEFSCEEMLPGDLVVPFVERAPVAYRTHSSMDLFPATPARVRGKIMASRDFDSYLGSGQKIYITVGEPQGIKAGDYLRVVRDYRPESMDQTDAATFNADLIDDIQQHAPKTPRSQLQDLPRRVLGEAIVLSTHPGGATAMLTFSLEPAQLGDTVELEEVATE
jgi:hypothetical protein